MKKVICICLAVLFTLSLFAGCAGSGTTKGQQSGSTSTDGPPKPGGGTLSYWCGLNSDAAKTASSYDDIPLYQELQKRLGVDLKFMHPPVGMEAEQFKLLIASKDLPDLIEYDWFKGYPMGPEKAIADKVIISLNSLIPGAKTPNLSKVLKEDPDLDKSIKTDSGQYYVFPQIRDNALMKQKAAGLIIRRDWLEELKSPVPTCMDEWYDILKKFKEVKKVQFPYTSQLSRMQTEMIFVGAFGVAKDFYHDDGIVKFGQVLPGYKEYLATMNKWYKEGLIDPDIATIDSKSVDAKITGDKAGATIGSPDGGLGVYMQMKRKEDPKFTMVGAPYPSGKKGEKRRYGNSVYRYTTTCSVAISGKCKDKDLAARVLDYGYGEEGNRLYNYGIEGQSYTMKDGKPTFTEEITKNKDGLTFKQAMGRYSRNSPGGPFLKGLGPVMEQRMYPEQNAAAELFYQSVDWSSSLPILSFTKEEGEKLADIMSEVNNLSDEMTVKIIVGEKPLDAFDSYAKNIKDAKIDQAIKIYQAAFDRYKKR